MRILVIILVSAVVLLACNKEQVIEYETLYPLPYLPVYPGSSWTYIHPPDKSTVIHTTKPEYALHSYESKNFRGKRTEPVFVPVWEGQAVYGYSSPIIYYDLENLDESAWGDVQVAHLSEKVGEKIDLSNAEEYTAYRMVTQKELFYALDTAYYSNVLVVNDYLLGKESGAAPILFKIWYYAKDIGLIGMDDVIAAGSDTIPNLRLVDFHINK